MNQRWLPTLASAVLVTAGWAIASSACEGEKTAQAAVAKNSGVCTAAMAAKCTPAQAAACKAKASATTASVASTCSHGAAVMADAKESCAGHKSAMQAAVQAANEGCCRAKSSKNATARAKGSKSNAIVVAGAGGACKGDAAQTAGSGACSGRGMSMAAGESVHGDCDAGDDMAMCAGELKAAGSLTQVVTLKNGVMFVYTAEDPSQVRAVQTAMARRNQRWNAMTASGDKTRLCAECKRMRGAAASGKLTREIVNIEGGCLTLMTSTDPAIVTKLHAYAGTHTASRIKT